MPKSSDKKRNLQLNAKRRKLLAGIGEGLNVSEAGRLAGYGTAQSAHRAMDLIRLKTPEVLEKIGLSAEKLLKDHFLKALRATETKFFSNQGIVMETREVVNHDIRLRAAIELAKMHGLYPSRDRESEPPGAVATININLGFLGPETAAEILARARQRIGIVDRGRVVLDAARDEDQGRAKPGESV